MKMQVIEELLKSNVEFDGATYKVYDGGQFRLLTNAEEASITAELGRRIFNASIKNKLSRLSQAYVNANEADIPYLTTTFQADSYTQTLLTGILAGGAVPTGFTWRDVANNDVPMTFVELQGLSQAIVARGQVNWTKYQQLKTKIKQAKSKADLDLITW